MILNVYVVQRMQELVVGIVLLIRVKFWVKPWSVATAEYGGASSWGRSGLMRKWRKGASRLFWKKHICWYLLYRF